MNAELAAKPPSRNPLVLFALAVALLVPLWAFIVGWGSRAEKMSISVQSQLEREIREMGMPPGTVVLSRLSSHRIVSASAEYRTQQDRETIFDYYSRVLEDHGWRVRKIKDDDAEIYSVERTHFAKGNAFTHLDIAKKRGVDGLYYSLWLEWNG